MSELKVYRFLGQDEVWPDANLGSDYYFKSEADKKLRHNKYKRCLDKATICQLSIERYGRYIAEFKDCGYPSIQRWRFLKNHYEKWYQRWLNIAEQFKETK